MKKLTSFLLVLVLILLSGCNQTIHENSVASDAKSDIVDVKNTEMPADWTVYRSAKEFVDTSKYIFEGTVVAISFYVKFTGTIYDIFAIYEIDVHHTYKGSTNEIEYVAMLGGIKDYRESEQKQALEAVGGFNPSVGIYIVRGALTPEIGSTYLFCARDWQEPYIGGINPSQFALTADSSVTPEEIITYIQQNPQ